MTAVTRVRGERHTPWRRALRAWDRVSIYLPIALMSLLALGTYWLVRNSPAFNTQEASKPATHEVDYFMRNFTVKSYDKNGKLKTQVVGLAARHYSESDTLEIDQPNIRTSNELGRHLTATSLRAISNSDSSEVQLLGDARVVREAAKAADGQLLPRMEFRGEFLHVFANDERVKSHKPVVLTWGADRFTGDTFTYDNLTGIAELKGRVTTRLMHRASAAPQ